MKDKFLISCFTAVLLLLVGLSTSPASDLQPDKTAPAWLWVTDQPKNEEHCYFRKEFTLPATTKRVLLAASGDDALSVYFNGAKKGVSASGWNNPVGADVTHEIKPGEKNLIAIHARNGSSLAGAIIMLEVIDTSGEKQRLVSDSSWLASSRVSEGWTALDYVAKEGDWNPAVEIRQLGEAPWTVVDENALASALMIRQPEATPVDAIRMAPGFKAELLYSVPRNVQGSWVAMTMDDQQRLIVSDQYGVFYRVKIPALGETVKPSDVEEIPVDIGHAQGLLYANKSLYAVLNSSEHGGRGLYRISDSDGDDQFDKKELLRKFEELGGEHGPHAVILGPDGKSLYVAVGNQTPMTEMDHSRTPTNWGEDILLERPYGRGFMKDTPPPGGWIAKTDFDGKSWELIAMGFRNQYDIAFNLNGDLFTYDADMEWDINTPWYRPTRINLVASGGEFGWRHSGAKWPAYYPDSLPAIVDIGPGSPTGVTFGYGAKFPAKYQHAFFAADWSYGKLFAVHMTPSGAAYEATFEEFMSAQPLPLTDLVVNPADGALYVAIGGRRVQSGLYRVTYTGDESTAPVTALELTEGQKIRHQLEAFHQRHPDAIAAAWPHMGSEDRYIRYAARIALEHQPVAEWQEKVLTATDPEVVLNGMIGLLRHGDQALQSRAFAVLNGIDKSKLDTRQQLDLSRAYALAFTRMGEGTAEQRQTIANEYAALMPFRDARMNIEVLELLTYLEHPKTAEVGIALLNAAPSQEEQIAYAKSLRHLKVGWSRELRKQLLTWFTRAQGYKGGASFALFISEMKETALANTPEEDKVALKDIIEATPPTEQIFASEPRSFVKAWTMKDFESLINVGLEGGRDFDNGRKMFGAAACFACHRFQQEGGSLGPDLTSVAGKFSPNDLLESIIDPNKEISDQYGQMIFEMNNGSVVVGRIMNLGDNTFRVNTDMMNPDAITMVDRTKLKSMKESPVSMMPAGLINTLSEDDVLDLLAYLLSQGKADDPLFAK